MTYSNLEKKERENEVAESFIKPFVVLLKEIEKNRIRFNSLEKSLVDDILSDYLIYDRATIKLGETFWRSSRVQTAARFLDKNLIPITTGLCPILF